MAYSVNGKVYTDHPLMDEIVYNCKLILKDIVIKNDELANNYETQISVDESSYYIMIKEGKMTFNFCPLSFQNLKDFGYSIEEIRSFLNNRKNIPKGDRKELVEFISRWFVDHYEEKNQYYRSLMGLPPYNTTEYDVYITKNDIPSVYKKEVDFSKPLHLQSEDLISTLRSIGKLDDIIDSHLGSNYSYLKHLGNKRVDIYKARKAQKWDILYIPKVQDLVQTRFQEFYNINKEIYLKHTYQEAMAFNSDHYEQIMIIMVLCQTFNDMIVDVPEWYIRRDIFDIRSVQYFLEAYGVQYFKVIPLKYQIRIVKNLNKLIKYKSSNKNCWDILDIFSVPDTAIYNYYLFKKQLKYDDGYFKSENVKDGYDLEFVQAKIGESYDDYIKDLIYRTPYDDITYQDKYWDGEDTHSYIKNEHLKRDFTIEGTKYMSIEYKVSLSDYLFQIEYFLGLILDSKIDTSDIKIVIPSIESGSLFKLSDLFLFLCLLTLGYEDGNTDIIRPNFPDPNKHKKTDKWYSDTFDDKQLEPSDLRGKEKYYDWLSRYYPEFFIEEKDRIYGFNSDVDLKELESILQKYQHSSFGFDLEKRFTLSDFGVDKYIVPDNIDTIDDLINIYNNNKECYEKLKTFLVEDSDDRDEYVTAQFLFTNLFTKKFDYEFYTDDKNNNFDKLEETLENRDFILYNLYNKLISEKNIETRRDEIRNVMNDVVSTLEYYLTSEGLEYIFAFCTVSSFFSIITYIYLMVNFFKSYKVYFLDPFITYVIDDRLENNATGHDTIAEKEINYWKEDKAFSEDTDLYYTVLRYFEEDEKQHDNMKEILDIHGHYEPDPEDDLDYNGMYPSTKLIYKDANGGYASDYSCIPYIMLNAGRPQGGAITTWDLNGSTPAEHVEYLDVNAGYSDNDIDWRQNYWKSAFNYVLDGGAPSTNQFLTRTMNVKVIDDQIESEVRISALEGNKLIQKDDGLYIKQEWATLIDFETLEQESNTTFDKFQSYYDLYSDYINSGAHCIAICSFNQFVSFCKTITFSFTKICYYLHS